MTPADQPSNGEPRYELRCENALARERITAWLESTHLAWPGRFHLTVHVGDSHTFTTMAPEIFRQPALIFRADPDIGTLRIEWTDAPAAAEIHPTLPQAELWLSRAALAQFEGAERNFLLVVLIFLLRRLGWYHVHGAALTDPQGRGWLIAGDSNCGKSTTTALLATRGWKIGTDDIGFLARRDNRIVSLGMRTPIALRASGLALLGDRRGVVMERRNKEGFWPEELGGSWSSVVIPEIIAFPKIGERTAVTPSSPRAALAQLVKWSVWVLCEPAYAQEHLDVLGQVARQSRIYDLTLGPDLFDHPDMLEELIP
jgi:hypothetical protein